MKKIIILKSVFVLLLIQGCNEFVTITGTILNRLDNHYQNSATIIVVIKNSDSSLVSNFMVSIKENYSNKCIVTPKISNLQFPVNFNLPDEQINSINKNVTELNIIIEYPLIGVFQQNIEIKQLNFDKPIYIIFNLGIIPAHLRKLPILKYISCH